MIYPLRNHFSKALFSFLSNCITVSCFNAFNYSVKVMNLLPEGVRGGAISVSALFGGAHPEGPACWLSGLRPAIRSQNERHFR